MGPSSHIFRLLLAPDDFCIRGVAGENLRQFLNVEGVDLLQAKNCGVGNFVFSLVILQVVKDFSGAKNDALGAFCDLGVGQYFLECAAGEVGYRTGGTGISEKPFGVITTKGLMILRSACRRMR